MEAFHSSRVIDEDPLLISFNTNLYLLTSTKTPVEGVVHAPKQAESPVKVIALIGERNSGSTWMSEELERCFGEDIRVSFVYD